MFRLRRVRPATVLSLLALFFAGGAATIELLQGGVIRVSVRSPQGGSLNEGSFSVVAF